MILEGCQSCEQHDGRLSNVLGVCDTPLFPYVISSSQRDRGTAGGMRDVCLKCVYATAEGTMQSWKRRKYCSLVVGLSRLCFYCRRSKAKVITTILALLEPTFPPKRSWGVYFVVFCFTKSNRHGISHRNYCVCNTFLLLYFRWWCLWWSWSLGLCLSYFIKYFVSIFDCF